MLEPSRIKILTVRAALFSLAASPIVPNVRRHAIYRALGVKLAEEASIQPGCHVADSGSLVLGEGAVIWRDCYVECSGGIVLEDWAGVAPRSMLLTSSHLIGPPYERVGPHRYAPVVIGAGAWVGAGAVVLPGVTIGAGAIVNAGAVVTKDCEPNAIYAGVPARKVRDITEPGVPRRVISD